jgi:glycosyltransferase involved in cell wall biosynthesis
MRQKGITDAINSVAEINEKRGKIVARLDIYGPVEDDYKDELDELTAKYSDFVSYCGVTDSHNSVQTLCEYYALLFPTCWHGEGFPGTILDCYASAIPVLASDWNANKEIIVHGKTGMIYPSEEVKTLTETIEWALDNKDKMDQMKHSCREEYEKYTPEHISGIICSAIVRE